MESLQHLRRITIIGRPGSGKSTLARRLGVELGLPVFHTEVYGWQPGWKPTPFSVYRDEISRIAEKKDWIIDGNSRGTFDLRFPRADAIIWVHPPIRKSLIRVILRTSRYLGRTRPGSAPGCKDRFHPILFRQLLTFDRTVAPAIRLAIDLYGVQAKTLVLTSFRDANALTGSNIAERLSSQSRPPLSAISSR